MQSINKLIVPRHNDVCHHSNWLDVAQTKSHSLGLLALIRLMVHIFRCFCQVDSKVMLTELHHCLNVIYTQGINSLLSQSVTRIMEQEVTSVDFIYLCHTY